MSPLEIPGTSINIPYPSGKQKCPNGICGRDFNNPKVRAVEDIVSLHCPWCNYKIKTYSRKEIVAKQKKKRKIVKIEKVAKTTRTIKATRNVKNVRK